MPTFEEFYASVTGGKPLADDFRYQVLRVVSEPQLSMFRMILMPPKTPDDVLSTMRSAFGELWQDRQFLADYSRVEASEPILVSGSDGQKILEQLGKVSPKMKSFLIDYIDRMTAK